MVEYITTVHDLDELKRVDAQLADMAKVGWRLRFVSEIQSTHLSTKGWVILWERNQQNAAPRW